MTDDETIAIGRRVVRMESEALRDVEQRLGEGFARAVDLVAGCAGRVILSGVGKSGLIGRKIAATLTSTGTPATFLHPTENGWSLRWFTPAAEVKLCGHATLASAFTL